MKLFKQLGLMIGGLMLLAAPVMAEDVPGLFEAEVPVESQDRELRDAAIQAALQQVLVRVSGRQMVLTVTGIEAALEQANRYVQQFRYRERENAASGEASSQVLWVRFDKRAIEQLLHDNRLPVWGRTRPATLVWLVVDDRQKRQLLSNDMQTPAREILERQAELRGIPLRLPLMDLADRSVVGVSDVWGNFEDNLLQASARYQPEAVLVGRVFKTYANNWNARWTLYQDGRRQDWTASGEGLGDAIQPGISQLADQLAARFARVGQDGNSSSLRVRVTATGARARMPA